MHVRKVTLSFRLPPDEFVYFAFVFIQEFVNVIC